MTYQHYFSYQASAEEIRAMWPRLRADTATILDAVRLRGIGLTGPLGYGDPVIESQTIAFNGLGSGMGEALLLSLDTELATISPEASAPFTRGFCKTHRRPYDMAVTAVLLRAWTLAPEHVAIGSDGTWKEDWQPARRLVSVLFGDSVRDDPLIWAASTGPASVRTRWIS
jgi:hypothetical protein